QHSGRVVAVFSGHVHRAAAGQVGSIPATVVQCIATTLRKGEYPPHMKTRPVYQVHRFDPVWGFATETRIVGTGPSVASSKRPPRFAKCNSLALLRHRPNLFGGFCSPAIGL